MAELSGRGRRGCREAHRRRVRASLEKARLGSHGGGWLYGLIIRYYLNRRDQAATGSAREIVPGVGIKFVGLRFMLHQGLIALAVFAEDFFAHMAFLKGLHNLSASARRQAPIQTHSPWLGRTMC